MGFRNIKPQHRSNKSSDEKTSKGTLKKIKPDLSSIFGGKVPQHITGAHVTHLTRLYSALADTVEVTQQPDDVLLKGIQKSELKKIDSKTASFAPKLSFDSVETLHSDEVLTQKIQEYKVLTKRKKSSVDDSVTTESVKFGHPLQYDDKTRSCSGMCSVDDGSYIESSRRCSIKQIISNEHILNDNRMTLKKANYLHYRENVFRAATRLTQEMPPYPDWVYQNEELKYQDIYKINVGGVIFFLFDDTLKNLVHTKLAHCIRTHKNKGIPFFDRDPKCFNAILNFYRTGRLHVPSDICLTLYDRELEFWGINEMFIEPCCWSTFYSFKTATNTVKKFVEDVDKSVSMEDEPDSAIKKWRIQLNSIMTEGSGSVKARWMSTLSTFFILSSIVGLIVSTSAFGRVDITSGNRVQMKDEETVTEYFFHTKIAIPLNVLEIIICGYFLAEFFTRLLLSSKRLEFFSDTLNWVDFLATTTSLFSTVILENSTGGSIEGYVFILKLPRILRLFKLTKGLRSGMEAFILTIKASAKQLKLVFLMMFIAASIFGSLLFVVEMLNETDDRKSNIKNIYFAVWLAIVTMTTVGYGDIHALSYPGYIVSACCILCGVIICQLPVPIFLMNFRVYHNQANARLTHKKNMIVRNTNPEAINDAILNTRRDAKKKKKGEKTFARLFNHI